MGRGVLIRIRKVTKWVPSGWVAPIVLALFVAVLAVIAVVNPSVFSPNRSDSFSGSDQFVTLKASYWRDCGSCSGTISPLPNLITANANPGYQNNVFTTLEKDNDNHVKPARLQGVLEFRVQ